MQEISPEQQESLNIQAVAFSDDPRHVRYIESDANNAVLVQALHADGLEFNAENLHRVFTDNLGRLELKPEPNARPGGLREGDINFNVLRARQAADEQRKANDALLAVQEQDRLRLEAEKQVEKETVTCGLAAQQSARRQQSAPVQFRNGQPVASTESLPTSRNRQSFTEAVQRHGTELLQDASRNRRHL